MARGRVTTANPKFIELFYELANGKYQKWSVWSDFILMTACAISNSVDKSHFDKREEMYFNCIKKYTQDELAIFPQMLCELVNTMSSSVEQDFLGNLYMQLELGNREAGQFFTPYSVCRLMAEVTTVNCIEQIEKEGYITINDPTCGAGATLIAAANVVASQIIKRESSLNWQNHLLFSAQDIDMITGLMCYIQLSLMGCAGYIKIGDSLWQPMITDDDMTNYWFTPIYFSEVWHYRRIFHGMDTLMHKNKSQSKPKETDFAPKISERAFTVEKSGQLSFF